MKPQQQHSGEQGQRNVYVQKPDGKEENIAAGNPQDLAGQKDEAMAQTANHTPSTYSKEVTDGEDG